MHNGQRVYWIAYPEVFGTFRRVNHEWCVIEWDSGGKWWNQVRDVKVVDPDSHLGAVGG